MENNIEEITWGLGDLLCVGRALEQKTSRGCRIRHESAGRNGRRGDTTTCAQGPEAADRAHGGSRYAVQTSAPSRPPPTFLQQSRHQALQRACTLFRAGPPPNYLGGLNPLGSTESAFQDVVGSSSLLSPAVIERDETRSTSQRTLASVESLAVFMAGAAG